jgi:hypothetical protein
LSGYAGLVPVACFECGVDGCGAADRVDVELDECHWQPFEVGESAVADAEVVHGDRAAEL